MNSIAGMNESTFEYMKKTFVFQFQNINFNKNIITYKGSSVDLKTFELQLFLNHNSYITSDLTEDEIFEIIKVHADIHNILESEESKDDKDLISLDKFIALARKKEDFSENEKKEIDSIFELYKKMNLYEDFLTPEAKSVFNEFKNILKNLEVEVL